MSVMGLFLFSIAAIAVTWLWREGVAESPWLQEGEVPTYRGRAPPPASETGLVVFLGVALCLFFLLSAAFAMRMESSDWRSPPLPAILWFNTIILIAASVAMHVAQSTASTQLKALRKALAVGAVASVLFLLGQLWAWREMIAGGYVAAENPANAFFFLMTGAHGLHLAGGLVAISRAMARAWSTTATQSLKTIVGLCAIYWHFLLAVWLFLFALLMGGGDSLGMICRRLLV